MVIKNYRKDEIAARMLDTALDLYFKGGDGFSIIHLAAAAEEVLAGLIKGKKNESNSNQVVQTAWDKTISALEEIHAIHGTKRTKRQIIRFLNFTRNNTKHHTPKSDPIELSVCLELEVKESIYRAIENYMQHFGDMTEKVERYVTHVI
jgi:hypothetical protein